MAKSRRSPGVLNWMSYGLAMVLFGLVGPTLLRPVSRKQASRIFATGCRLCLRSIRIRVRGVGSMEGQPRIIYANHSSWLDQLTIPPLSPRPVRILANEKYFRLPFLRLIMRVNRHIPISPQDVLPLKREGMRLMASAIENGEDILVFPEGTRTTDDLPFQRSLFKYAAKNRIPITPAWIVGAGALYPRHAPLAKVSSGVIDVHLGKCRLLDQRTWESDLVGIESLFKARLRELEACP